MAKTVRGKPFVFFWGGVLFILLVIGAWSSWEHVRFWWLFEPLGFNDQGYPEYRHRETGVVMIRIPGGTFSMGSPPRPDGMQSLGEEPQHRVTLSPYLIAKYELTVEEWNSVMKDDPRALQGTNLPVAGVSWAAAKEFCRRAGFSLPTEAQWEFACRASDKDWVFMSRPGFQGRVPDVWDQRGARMDGLTEEWFDSVAKKLDQFVWFNENSGGVPHPVGEKKPNDFGLHDMIGSFAELCKDTFSESFYATPEASGLNPECTVPTGRVVRRGAFYVSPGLGYFRSTFRSASPGGLPLPFVGFRPAYYPLP